MAASPVSTDIAPWPFALALFIAMLAAFVALDLAKRVRVENAEERGRWLVASSISLGSGLWAAQALAVGGLKLAYPVGQHTMGALAVWVFALAVTAGSLMLAWSQLRSWPHLLGSAVLLGTGVVATQMAGVAVLGLQPGVSWRSPQLAAALGLACAGTGTAYMLYFQSQVRAAEAARRWQALAAIFLGMAMLASQQMVFSAAQLNLQFYSAYEGDLRSDTLAAIGSVGALAMLVALQALSFLEARMRTSLDNANSELRKQSHRDETTGLPNRQTFEDTLALAVREADKKQGRLALMYIALNGFRHVNETYGHHAGDLLLREMAGRLRALAEPQRVARLGGDEFLLLLADNPEKRSVTAAAAQVLQMLGRPYSLQGKDVSATCSIGVVLYPQHGAASTLISHAHVAMRASKSAGGATYSFFDLRLVNEAREQTELLRDLRLALAREQLELFYQPKVHAQSGQITGVESLIRWHHPERGLISPAVFIPLAERFGLICAIGAWVIDAACKQLSTWCDQGLRMRVAINISAHQLRQPDLIDQLTQALERHKVDPHLLTCEITESVAMEDTEATLKLLHAMAKVGLQISIDDFGSGFSSLAYLRVLPANELKIDRGFVLDLETSEEARKVAAAVVNLAKALQMKVVAEGVETEGQHEILRKLGCDQLQGFLFAKPMSAKALGLWAMQSHSPGEIAFRDSLYVDTVPAA